jgi:hypothetical protein
MKKIVFYSWQSDLPNGTNRTLIESALKDAAKEIGDDESTDIEPVIDRDTQGVSGAPNIATAIFQKIDSADIFVADVSIIGRVKKRAIPNPNVLIELGYALKSLGHERIILVFNTAFGKIEKLPFDLRMHRTLTYQCAESVTDRSEIKRNLAKDFKSALLIGFSHISPKKTSIPIIDIIKNRTASKKIDLRTYLAELFNDLEKLQPTMKRDGGTVQDLLSALPKTEKISIEFAKLSQTIVLMNDKESAKEVFQWFGKLLTKYDPILPTGGGKTWNCDGDFFKFLGHEFFVNFITPFLREEKWDELKNILGETLKVEATQHYQNGRKGSWSELSDYLPLLADESKKVNKKDLHANILKERYTTGGLASTYSFRDFLETDYFLYLYGSGTTQDVYRGNWYPRSVLWLDHTPSFIIEAQNYPLAMKIGGVLGISDIDEFKRRISSSQNLHYARFFPITSNEINKIGSEGGAQIIYNH